MQFVFAAEELSICFTFLFDPKRSKLGLKPSLQPDDDGQDHRRSQRGRRCTAINPRSANLCVFSAGSQTGQVTKVTDESKHSVNTDN